MKQAFEAFGQVASVSIIKDKFSNQSKGFGFVEMPGKEEAQAAITGMNGKELKGRTLNVNEARPRTDDREAAVAAAAAEGGLGADPVSSKRSSPS